jgi:hypothetical protein
VPPTTNQVENTRRVIATLKIVDIVFWRKIPHVFEYLSQDVDTQVVDGEAGRRVLLVELEALSAAESR